eukprot:TRINITY_DN1611_c0_g1_i2.p1 TRINITY_DN1611_c0_g1~~TRINITY_DN1611_c0_g1_i2.p1  ORF type:complete len:675 (+),score=157.52 TRINITY_DN1611_c0_g1_i2:903-2927(+)
MSTYLLALCISDFTSVQQVSVAGTVVSVWARTELVAQGAFSVDFAAKVLDYYATLFAMPYALPKLDIIAVPHFGLNSAMENWGMVTFFESLLLIDPNYSSDLNKQVTALVVAHELAHQWFGNLVTAQWWSSLWMNEGFANYLQTPGVDNTFPDWGIYDQQYSDTTLNAITVDALSMTHPVINPDVYSPTQISAMFDAITYDKGAALLRMTNRCIGETAFNAGLRSYISANAYSSTNASSVIDAWQQNMGPTPICTAQALLPGWLNLPGYPAVTTEPIVIDDSIDGVAMQQRFAVEFTANVQEWTVPYTYTTAAAPDASDMILFNGEISDASFPMNCSAQWLAANTNADGYYITLYSPSHWDCLVDVLNTPAMGGMAPMMRANLLTSAFVSTTAGPYKTDYTEIAPTDALRLAQYLRYETELVPWQTALRFFDRLRLNMDWDVSRLTGWQAFCRYVAQPTFAQLTWSDTGTHQQRLLRPMLIEFLGENGDAAVIAQAQSMFQAWRSGTAIPANLIRAVLRVAVYNNASNWQYMKPLAEAASTWTQLDTFMYAMAATPDTTQQMLTIDFARGLAGIEPQYFPRVVRYVCDTTAGGRYSFWSSRQFYPPAEFYQWLTMLGPMFSQTAEQQEFIAYVNQNGLGGAASIQRAVAQMNANVNWFTTSEPAVYAWLQQFVQ